MARTSTSASVAPSKAKIVVEQVTITPEMAEAMLAHNAGNRNVRSGQVDMYAREMANGRWRLTGDGPRFDEAGALIDGQHRLLAIVKAGVPVDMFVFRGISNEARPAIDTGIARTAADFLRWSGEHDTMILAAAVRLAITMEKYDGKKTKTKIPTQDIYEWLTVHPEIRPAVNVARKCVNIGLTPSVMVYCFYQLAKIDEGKALDFYYTMADREGLYRGDPRHTLTRRMDQARRSKERFSSAVQVSMLYRAWNAWRKQEQLQFIRITSNGAEVEIPRPI